MDWLIVILIDRSMQLMNLFFHSSHSFFLSFFFLHHRSQNEKLTRTGQGKPLSRSGGSVVVETIRWLGEEEEKKGRGKKRKKKKSVLIYLWQAGSLIILQRNSNSRMDLFDAWLTLGLGTVGYCVYDMSDRMVEPQRQREAVAVVVDIRLRWE